MRFTEFDVYENMMKTRGETLVGLVLQFFCKISRVKINSA